jgi:hypothetical protein
MLITRLERGNWHNRPSERYRGEMNEQRAWNIMQLGKIHPLDPCSSLHTMCVSARQGRLTILSSCDMSSPSAIIDPSVLFLALLGGGGCGLWCRGLAPLAGGRPPLLLPLLVIIPPRHPLLQDLDPSRCCCGPTRPNCLDTQTRTSFWWGVLAVSITRRFFSRFLISVVVVAGR